jgi:hypothetical protein
MKSPALAANLQIDGPPLAGGKFRTKPIVADEQGTAGIIVSGCSDGAEFAISRLDSRLSWQPVDKEIPSRPTGSNPIDYVIARPP